MSAPTTPTPTTGSPAPVPAPSSPPAPATPGAPSEQREDFPLAAEKSKSVHAEIAEQKLPDSYSDTLALFDDGSESTRDVFNALEGAAREQSIAPAQLHAVTEAVVRANPKTWDDLTDVAAFEAGRIGLTFEQLEAALDGLQAHLVARDSLDAMKSDPEFRAALAGSRGQRAQKWASQRVDMLARAAFGRG